MDRNLMHSIKSDFSLAKLPCELIFIGDYTSKYHNSVAFSRFGIVFQATAIVSGARIESAIPISCIQKIYKCLKSNISYFTILVRDSCAASIKIALEFNQFNTKLVKSKYSFNPADGEGEFTSRFITFKLHKGDTRDPLQSQTLSAMYEQLTVHLAKKEFDEIFYSKVTGFRPIVTISDTEESSDDEPECLFETKIAPLNNVSVPKKADKCTETEESEITVSSSTSPTPTPSTSFQSEPSRPRERIIPITIDKDHPAHLNLEKVKQNARERFVPIILKGTSQKRNRQSMEKRSQTVTSTSTSTSPNKEVEIEEDIIPEPVPSTSSQSKPKLAKSKHDFDVIEIDDSETLDNENSSTEEIVIVYPRENQGNFPKITITVSDIKCLEPESWLNDNIIDFWCRHFYLEVLTSKDRRRCHIFSTFFYPSLTKAFGKLAPDNVNDDLENRWLAFRESVSPWTKHVDIFEKDFTFIPLSDCHHWVLAVICFPGLVTKRAERKMIRKMKRPRLVENYGGDSSESGTSDDEAYGENGKYPCILLFDSCVDEHCSRSHIFNILQCFLQQESGSKSDINVLFDSDAIPGYAVSVPQQTNTSDCGLYILRFLELFYFKPIPSLKAPLPDMTNWFTDSEGKSLRFKLYKDISKYAKEYCPETLHLMPRVDVRPSVIRSS